MIRFLPLFFVWIAAIAFAQGAALLTQPQLDQFVTDLNNAKFEKREKANFALGEALVEQYAMTEASLKAALANPLSLEQQRRAEALLEKTKTTDVGLLQTLLRVYSEHPQNAATLVVLNKVQAQLDRGEKLRDAIVKAGFEVERRFPGERGLPESYILNHGGTFYRVQPFSKFSLTVTPVVRGPRGTYPPAFVSIPLDQFTTRHQRAAHGFAPRAALPNLRVEAPGVQLNIGWDKFAGVVVRTHTLMLSMDTKDRVTDFFVLQLGFNRAAMERAYLRLKEQIGQTFYGQVHYNPR